MKYNRIKSLGMLLFLAWMVVSCKENTNKNSNETIDENLIEISSEQFNQANMQLGTITIQTFSDEVSSKGLIQAPSDAIAKISSPVAGSVNGVRVKVGDYARRGQVICSVGGNEFMSLQQEFAEAAAEFQKAKADFERHKALRAENIGAKKDYVSSESIFKSAQASYNALKARIQNLNINPAQIENGQLYSSFPVVSPIDGYITNFEVVVGQYVDMMSEVAEVVNTSKLQLKLSIFEVDIPKIKEGQKVSFKVSGHPDEQRSGTIITIGKAINPDTKSIDCIAKIEDSSISGLVNQSYVDAKIEIANIEAKALPSTAFQKSSDEYFVFVVEENNNGTYKLRKTLVEIGRSNDKYIEIISGIPSDNTQVIVSGVDTL